MKNKGKLSLVIFDMDGTLVNTEKHYREVNLRLFTELDIHLSSEEHDSFVGTTAVDMWSALKLKYGLKPDVETLVSQEQQAHIAHLTHEQLVPIQGVPELIDAFQRQNVFLAVGSSSSATMIELIIGKLGIKEHFQRLMSGNAVPQGKPAPDLFLALAKHFNVPPAHCLVFEDAKHGVTAAKSAGMQCWAYRNPHSGAQDLSQADFVFEDYAEALNLYLGNSQ